MDRITNKDVLETLSEGKLVWKIQLEDEMNEQANKPNNAKRKIIKMYYRKKCIGEKPQGKIQTIHLTYN